MARGRYFISIVTDHYCGKYVIMIAEKQSLETDGSLHTQIVTANFWGFLVTRICVMAEAISCRLLAADD